ncbi:MAG: hypothetical protein ABI612_02140 [Betaproteobacteria bacterium]
MNWRWLLVILVLFGAWNHWHSRPVSYAPGVLVSSQPQQSDVATIAGAPPEQTGGGAVGSIPARNGYRITALQTFSLEARVLGAEHYRFDREADVAPVDLALGWGPMSDQSVLNRIEISQRGRFFHWHVDEFPIPRHEIEVNSANMHMIPANDTIASQLQAVRPGQIVKFSGYLVEVTAADGWRWRSSLTREDTGAGACELVWVEKLMVE